MSKDYIAFDPSGLDVPPKEEIQKWIDSQIGEGLASSLEMASEKIKAIIEWAGDKFGSTLEGNQWTMWPPMLMAEGRHCTFNLGLNADSMTFMMMLSDQCKKHGLIMIDPSGFNPFVTIPGGGGILD